jgi:ribosome-binding factor A
MSDRRRQRRVESEIERRASQFIREELKDPRLGFLTITGVDINSDLTNAIIHVSVLGDETEKMETMEALQRARGVVKRDIGDWLQIRTTPDIHFKLDTSLERGARILELMNSLHSDEQAEEQEA